MKAVIDTNVVISGVFFGGYPQKILDAAVKEKFTSYATLPIIDEYEKVINEIIFRRKGQLNKNILEPFLNVIKIIFPESHIEICRDDDDNKFI